jgi:8-oxo-dGTP diphosphatase
MATPRRFRILLTARLLLHYREHTLYLMQTKGNGGGFTLPGGRVKGEEFAKEGLIREAFEEVGILLTKKSLKLVHVMHKRLNSTVEIIFFFKSSKWKNEPIAKESEKFSNYVWLPDDEPPKRLPAVIKAAMADIAVDKVYSQYPSKAKENKKKKIEPIVEVKKVVKSIVKPSKKAVKKKSKKAIEKIEPMAVEQAKTETN